MFNLHSIKFKSLMEIILFLTFIVYAVLSTIFTLENQKSDSKVINVAGRQRMLTQKMSKEVLAINSFNDERRGKYIQNLNATSVLFDKSLSALLEGSGEMNVPKTENPEVRSQLEKVKSLWEPFKKNISAALSSSPGDQKYSAAVDYIEKNNVSLLKEMNKAVGLFEKSASGKVINLIDTLYYLLAGSFLLGFISLFFVNKIVTKPLSETVDVICQVADGNYSVEVEVKSKDEIGKLRENIGKMAAVIKEKIAEANQKTLEAENSASEAGRMKLAAEKQQAYLADNTRIMLTEIEKFAEGDLTVYVEPEREDDEIGRLFKGFNAAVAKIKEMTIKLTEAIEATASASAQISSSAEEMAAGAQEQSSQSAEIASAVEEMTRAIMETSEHAAAAADISKNAETMANDGEKTMKATVEGMHKISEVVGTAAETIKELGASSEKIGAIVGVIDDIADQTNLLALNAAIEAARAGEHGRGFAVVADEVRKLAERTTKATQEIVDMINSIQEGTTEVVVAIESGTEEVQKGIELAHASGKVLEEITKSAEITLDRINQVAAAAEEESATAEQISRSIEGINSVTQETASGVQQIARAAEDLNNLTVNLQNLVVQYKIDNYDENHLSNLNVRENGRITSGY